MELFLTRRFTSRFEKLPRPAQSRIRSALEDLGRSPLEGKRLSGTLEGDFSWRVGRYRIIYTIVGGRIIAETVRHRRDVYR